MKIIYKDKIKDYVRPSYYFFKDIFDFQGRKRLKKNNILNDLHLGERAFLLLTGESLQQIDINKLKDEYTAATQFIFFHEEIKNLNLNYYVSVEPNQSFYPNAKSWPESYLGLGRERIKVFYQDVDEKFNNKTVLFLHSDNYKHIENNNLLKDKIKYFVKGKKELQLNEEIPYKIIADLTKRSISGGGAVFFSILILMYMGFKEIYLCGAGYTYDPLWVLHFYDNFVFSKTLGKDKAEIEARKAINAVGGSLEYYGLYERENLYRSICVIRKYDERNKDNHRILNNYAKSQGVKIYNIVPEGFESPIYEKVTWHEVESTIVLGKPDNI